MLNRPRRRGARSSAQLLVLISLAGIALGGSGGSVSRGEGRPLARATLESPIATDVVEIEIDPLVRRRVLEEGRGTIRAFPLPGRVAVDLEITSFNLLAPGATFVRVDESGAHTVRPPVVRTFRGHVPGDADSLVSLSFHEDQVSGFVRTWDAEYIVASEPTATTRSGRSRMSVRRRTDRQGGVPPFECGNASDTGTHVLRQSSAAESGFTALAAIGDEPAAAAATVDQNTLLRASIAIDATVEFYQHFGTLAAAQSYILGLMAQVSTIYESEVSVQLEVGYLRLFTTDPDPYTDGSESTSVLLTDLRNEWLANQTGVTRTVAHLFSVRGSGGAGLAYVDVLCNTFADYGVSTLTANGGSWEKDLVAHELGHNFSSPHTHCYVPEIDRCAAAAGCFEGSPEPTTGTIMSYCSQKQSVFHPRVKNEQIRPAAEAAYPSCIDAAGLPGAVLGGAASALLMTKPQACPVAEARNDDSVLDSFLGYGGTAQMAWIKRFTPGCYPFRVTDVEVLIGHTSSVAAGRPMRLLVYADPSGSGDPANSTLIHSEDVTVQVVSSGVYNSYPLSAPLLITAGDYYVGFYDLLADIPSTFIATLDDSRDGDSFHTANSTSPDDFGFNQGATWMLRAAGGAVDPGSVALSWGPACNEASTPGQDYGIYSGPIGVFADATPLTCSTARATSHLTSNAAGDRFFLVVPQTTAVEGSYGTDASGVERPAATLSCKPQEIEGCL